MSKGKDIRATIETKLEDAAWDWLQDKDNKAKRHRFRAFAECLAVLRDPDDWDDKNTFAAVEKEFIGRVKD